jgi:GNAT superfamily N-acetyltransferase
VIRRATPDDADAIADVLTAARDAQAWFPPLHSPEETRSFVRDRLLPGHETWVVESEGRVVAFAALTDDHLGHLFVHPDAQHRGIGTALLEHTQRLLPGGFSLWTHQASEARAFYEARGLVAVEFTDGATTMEKIPDVRYEWRPSA